MSLVNSRIPIETKKRRIVKKQSSMAALSKEFADSTSMHGLKFISQDDASLPERILWVLLFCIGFFFAVGFSWKLWNNWQTSPVLITIKSANFPMTNYPFPTVTVCSVNKVSTRALGSWMSNNPEAKGFLVDQMRKILKVISTNRVEDDEKDEIIALNELMVRANITSDNRRYEQLMNTISPNCSEMIVYCTWEGKEEDCAQLFETEATDDGYCCSFNSIVLSKDKPNNRSKTLRYGRQAGVYAGLSVILNSELEDYNVTSSASVGFKVSIQDPDDFARTGRVGFLASPGTQIEASVTGQTQITDDRINSISLKERLCTTDNEINLTYFEDYTGPYCQLDCLTRLFLQECRCVPYYFPVKTGFPDCNISSYNCLDDTIAYQISNTSACDCPDRCNLVWYRNEISSGIYPNEVTQYPPTIFKRPEFRNMRPSEFQEYAKKNFVKLNVYFKTISGLCYIMDQRTSWADFISATGGLLGLGFGFSILSAAELFYFLLIRWIYYWHKAKKEEERVVRLFPASKDLNVDSMNDVGNKELYGPSIRRPVAIRRSQPGQVSLVSYPHPPLYNAWRLTALDDQAAAYINNQQLQQSGE